MIDLIDVHKAFDEGRASEVQALRGVRLTLAPGVTVLRGPSGSGKTTLLAVAGCLARPTSGRVHVERADVTRMPEPLLARLRRATFGVVFQHFNLIRGLSVLENVMLPAYPDGEPPRALAARALDLLARLEVGHLARRRPERLSGGEAQRVAIARALVNGPRVVLADEPTAHLDSERARGLLEVFADLKAAGTSLVVGSHDPLVTEASVVDRVVELRDGRVVP